MLHFIVGKEDVEDSEDAEDEFDDFQEEIDSMRGSVIYNFTLH